jgi:hypothetical protein
MYPPALKPEVPRETDLVMGELAHDCVMPEVGMKCGTMEKLVLSGDIVCQETEADTQEVAMIHPMLQ